MMATGAPAPSPTATLTEAEIDARIASAVAKSKMEILDEMKKEKEAEEEARRKRAAKRWRSIWGLVALVIIGYIFAFGMSFLYGTNSASAIMAANFFSMIVFLALGLLGLMALRGIINPK